MAKKITNRSLLGQRGINLVEECVLAMGFAWHPSNQAVEAGIDGYIELRNPDTEHALNLVVAVQSKARTDFASETPDTFSYYCDQDDLDYWMQGNVPVLLVVSRPNTREAYWADVKSYFGQPANRGSHTINFQKARDRFDVSARPRLFDLARPRDSGLYLAPLPKTESLLPNLLRACFPTEQINFASTKLYDPKQVIDAFRSASVTPDPDWVIQGGQIISFRPLDQDPWPSVCGPNVTRRSTASLASSTDADERRLFVRLLTRCLEARCRQLDVRFDSRRGVFYFAATDRLQTREVTFQSSARQSSRTVFEAYREKESNRLRFCRHFAFEGRFRRLGEQWYLEVTPTYVFTWDGRRPDRFGEDRLKGIKRLERNRAVFGQLLTWFDLLTRSGNLFQEDYPHLAFERPEALALGVGIDDAAWFGNEDPDEAARLDADVTPTNLLFDT